MGDVVAPLWASAGDKCAGSRVSAKRSASGNRLHNTSRTRSPPRIDVSQSWTIATRRGMLASAPYHARRDAPARGVSPPITRQSEPCDLEVFEKAAGQVFALQAKP